VKQPLSPRQLLADRREGRNREQPGFVALLGVQKSVLRRSSPSGATMAGYPVNRGGLAAFTFLAWGRTRTLAVALQAWLARPALQFVLAATTVATFVRTVAR
jgi:hypothetical protein